MMTLVGSRFDRYEILSRLGAGGMGEVYLAEDLRLDRKVALKLLPAEFTQDEDRVRRFIQEAKAASALNHPNIVTIYGGAQPHRGSLLRSRALPPQRRVAVEASDERQPAHHRFRKLILD